jgi:hypothetical protein
MTASVASRLVAFALVLAVLFGGGLMAGAAVGPERDVVEHQSTPRQERESAPHQDRDAGHDAPAGGEAHR